MANGYGRKSVLHFAPPWAVEKRLRASLAGYWTADIQRPDVDMQLDITSLPFADNTFDGIICSHVLEHIVNDRRAMKEMSRVLDADGWALIVVPMTAGQTFEDAMIVEPAARLAAFGQADHVRRYGPDVEERLNEWFVVQRVSEMQAIGNLDPILTGVDANGLIFMCGRRLSSKLRSSEPLESTMLAIDSE
jgi:SAM-dependent methyltransferase